MRATISTWLWAGVLWLTICDTCGFAQAKMAMTPMDAGTRLGEAAKSGDLAEIKSLLAAGVPVNMPNNRTCTPLHEAAIAGRKEVAAFLIEQGADVNARTMPNFWSTWGPNATNCTVLQFAAWHGRRAIVELLLDHGVDLRLDGQFNG
ncbi:MAG: ankyrin repeat domain-containing protein, partial [Solirubrobacterales bacterium]